MREEPEVPDEERVEQRGSGPALDPLQMHPDPGVAAAALFIGVPLLLVVAVLAVLASRVVSKVRGRDRRAMEGDEADE